jgi:hypothetical protein
VHLTNYSVQKYYKDFSKFEEGNEVSFNEFQNFIDIQYPDKKINVFKDIYPKICEIIKITMSSVKNKINAFDRHSSFEIFGYDFILDSEFTPFLLEINTNPGLEESSNLIRQLVPRMIEDALRLTIDDMFPTRYIEIEENEQYKSPFPVDNYSETDNLWDFVCSIKKKN